MFNNGTKKNNLTKKIHWELGLTLVKHHLDTIRQNQRFARELRHIIEKNFQNPVETPQEPPKRSNTIRRCSKCPRSKNKKGRNI